MSIESRKEQKEQQAQELTSPVKPVRVGSKKGKASSQAKPSVSPQAQPPVDEPELDEPEDLVTLARRLAEAQIQMSKAQTQMANQIVEDHKILTDHELRMRRVEAKCGIASTSPVANPLAATQPIESRPQSEPMSELKSEPAEPKPVAKPQAEPEIQVTEDDGYEVRVCKEGWGTLTVKVKI